VKYKELLFLPGLAYTEVIRRYILTQTHSGLKHAESRNDVRAFFGSHVNRPHLLGQILYKNRQKSRG